MVFHLGKLLHYATHDQTKFSFSDIFLEDGLQVSILYEGTGSEKLNIGCLNMRIITVSKLHKVQAIAIFG
ncbi:MAG: hypothetical protein IPJ39_22360 [Saprospiraceae bacterium]|nr:hypothetical protein [Saprospiraceae bacterium]